MNDLIEKVNNMRWGGKYTTEDIIALVREHDFSMTDVESAENHDNTVRADERQRCIDAAHSVPTGYQIGIEWKLRYAAAYKNDLIKALEKQE